MIHRLIPTHQAPGAIAFVGVLRRAEKFGSSACSLQMMMNVGGFGRVGVSFRVDSFIVGKENGVFCAQEQRPVDTSSGSLE